MEDKVFCINCKWITEKKNCSHPTNIISTMTDTYYSRTIDKMPIKFPSELNRNNDCQNFMDFVETQ